jgi:hypothetical protein
MSLTPSSSDALPAPASAGRSFGEPDPQWSKWIHIGLAPFVLCVLLLFLVRGNAFLSVMHVLAAYATVTVAFLGGIHWGLGMLSTPPQRKIFTRGILLTVFAWIGGMMSPHVGLVVDGVLFIASYLIDRKVYPAHGLSAWLMLRFRWTAVASLCCFLAAAQI